MDSVLFKAYPQKSSIIVSGLWKIAGFPGTLDVLRATANACPGPDPVTAIIAGSNQIARGYEALNQSGFRIPDDISVAGLKDSEASSIDPTLTSVRIARGTGQVSDGFRSQTHSRTGERTRQLTIPAR